MMEDIEKEHKNFDKTQSVNSSFLSLKEKRDIMFKKESNKDVVGVMESNMSIGSNKFLGSAYFGGQNSTIKTFES